MAAVKDPEFEIINREEVVEWVRKWIGIYDFTNATWERVKAQVKDSEVEFIVGYNKDVIVVIDESRRIFVFPAAHYTIESAVKKAVETVYA